MSILDTTRKREIYSVLAIIAIGVIIFHFTVNFLISPKDSDKVVIVMSSGVPLLLFFVSVIMVKKYNISKMVAEAYIFLGLAFLCLGIGDVIWNILYYSGMETYPSIADIFFFLTYPMLIIFHLKNMKKFTPEIFTKKAPVSRIIMMILISLTLIGIYVFLSFSSNVEIDFDFWYGLIFVVVASITFSMTVHVSWTVRQGHVGNIWKLIMLGIFLATFGDVLYYHIELLQEFDMFHPVNLMWYASYFVILYAFIQHKRDF